MSERAVANRYARARAWVLLGVHVLFALHIVHWRLTGRTLAPLELSEVLQTIHYGWVTAGFVLMALVVVSASVFGRFFCSWGCHVLALQDASAWVLSKIRIRPKRVPSRALELVPFGAAFYLFVWPFLERSLGGSAAPELTTEQSDWQAWVTDDFWRNLPGFGVALATFLVSAGLLVYLLGTRAFCRTVCPYGAVFNLADRLAPGRILRRGACDQCGRCTRACDSGIAVHEEIARHGAIMSPHCLKDLDCVAACPTQALRFGFQRPRLVRLSVKPSVRPSTWRFSGWIEASMGLVTLASVLCLRDLYGVVPFLLALGVSVALALLSGVCLRLLSRGDVRFLNKTLKARGRLVPLGWAALLLASLFMGAVVHSGFVRYHEHQGHRAFLRVAEAREAERAPEPDDVREAFRHLELCAAVGLVRPAVLTRRLAQLDVELGDLESALRRVGSLLEEDPEDGEAALIQGAILERLGSDAEAEAALRVALLAKGPRERRLRGNAWERLAALARKAGRRNEAIAALEQAILERPTVARPRETLALLLTEDGRYDDAEAELRRALALEGATVRAHNNLAVVLERRGRPEEARFVLAKALREQPGSVALSVNLGGILLELGRTAEAIAELERALEIDRGNARARAFLERARQVSN